MIRKTEALVLRVRPFSRTSRVVTWLTPEHGRLVTLIKGAQRPKSAFLGQYDLFSTCELLYYSRGRSGLHIARECSPLQTRAGLRSNWRGAFCASYLCDLVDRVSPDRHAQPELYVLASQTLDFLCSAPVGPQVLYWLELRVTRAIGLAPQVRRCAACQRSLSAEKTVFSAAQGGLLCSACAARETGDTIPVSPDVAALLRRWLESPSARSAHITRCTRAQQIAFRRILGIFVVHHLGFLPESRSIALQMVQTA